MRLLTHNTLKNNSAAAKGKGFPLRITSAEVRVDDNNQSMYPDQQLSFVKSVLPTLDWPALVKVRSRDSRARAMRCRNELRPRTWQ